MILIEWIDSIELCMDKKWILFGNSQIILNKE